MKKLMIMIGLVMMSAGALAGVSFGYQGTLCNAQGAAVASATKTIVFRLYRSQTAATSEAVWGRSYVVKTGANGVFNVELTDDVGDPLTDGTAGTGLGQIIAQCAAASSSLYVGLTVSDSTGEISPRQKMIATPYSAYAIDVGTASGDFKVGGTLTVAGGIDMKGTDSNLTAGNVTAKTLVSSGSASMDKELTVKGNLESQQDLTVGGKLTVTGATTLNGGANVKGDLAATGKITDQGGEVGVPIGTIVMWSGSVSHLPKGWDVCDGETTYHDPYADQDRKVPDLRDKFIVGAGNEYSLTAQGGEKTHTLTTGEMPNHKHIYYSDNNPGEHGVDRVDKTEQGLDFNWSDASYKYGYRYYTSDAGEGKAHENRPPYYALYYIIKTGSN